MATGQERSGPLLLLDGMSLAFRAYFALPDTLATSTGLVTNAVHGFTSMLVYLIREQRPSALAVAFDAPGRHVPRRDPRGLQGRAGRDALAPAAAVRHDPRGHGVAGHPRGRGARLRGRRRHRHAGHRGGGARRREVVIVTGDRDSFQLVQDPYVRVLYNKRGVSDYTLYDEAGHLRALRGAAVAVRAAGLAARRPLGQPARHARAWGRRRPPSCSPPTATSTGSSRTSTSRRRSCARTWRRTRSWPARNARIIPLVRDVPLDVDVAHLDARRVGPGHGRGHVRPLRDEDGLATPGGAARRRRARRAGRRERRPAPPRAPRPRSPPPAGATRREPAVRLELRDVALPDDGGRGHRGTLGRARDRAAGPGRPLERHARAQRAGRRWCWWPPRARRPAWASWCPATTSARPRWSRSSTPCWPSPCRRPQGQGGHALAAARSASTCTGLEMDTAVAAYLLDASTGEYELAAAARADRPAHPRHRRARRAERDVAQEAAAEAADVVGMAPGFRRRIATEDMVMLHDDIETPLVRVLAKMEVAGIGVDRAELQTIADSLKDVRRHAPGRGAGAAPATSSTSTRRPSCARCSTTSSASRRARRPRPASRPTPRRSRACAAPTRSSRRCSRTARWRSCARPTARACWPRWQPDGRIHASFGQTVARTGRHLVGPAQPAQHPGAHRARQAVPARLRARPRACTFLVADYDQVELRVHRPPVGGPRAHRRHDVGVRRAPDGGRGRLRHRRPRR